MKLFYGSEEANLTIILLSIITTENVVLLHWQDVVVEKKTER